MTITNIVMDNFKSLMTCGLLLTETLSQPYNYVRDCSSVSRLRKMVVLCVRRMTLVHSLPSKTPHRSMNVFTFVGTVAKRKKCGRLLRIAPWSLNVSCTMYMFSGIVAFNGYTRNRGMIYCNASQHLILSYDVLKYLCCHGPPLRRFANWNVRECSGIGLATGSLCGAWGPWMNHLPPV